MSWFKRLVGQEDQRLGSPVNMTKIVEELMGPGLTGQYDWELREKAGAHQPPPPPEHMGLEGEYDAEGLLKRVALALDSDPKISQVSTLQLSQMGSTIILRGSVPSYSMLKQIIEVAGKVDGTKAVKVTEVTVETVS
jgi:hypothetical protein